MTSIAVKTMQDAWEMANRFFPTDYELDKYASDRAGYSVYKSTKSDNAWISDLATRLELNYANGDTMNIWIETGNESVCNKMSACADNFSLRELLILNLATLQLCASSEDESVKREAEELSNKITKMAYQKAK